MFACFFHFFEGGSAAEVDGHADELADGAEDFIDLLAGFEEAAGKFVGDDRFAQFVEFGDFLFGRRHAGEVFVTEFFAVGVDFLEEFGGFGILEEKADAGFGGDHFLVLGKGVAKFLGEPDDVWIERCVHCPAMIS